MRYFSLLAMGLALAACQSATPGDSAPDGGAESLSGEWEVLFDGTSMDHFRGFKRDNLPGSWGIDGNALAFQRSDDGGDIITREEYGDFELELEWKISEGGNSGIIYRATEEFDAPWMTGPEYQVLDNLRHPDARFGADRMAGANYDMSPSDSLAVKPVGEWNTARILAQGNHVEHWLNGKKVAEYELYSEEWNAQVAASKWKDHANYGRRLSGHIALQDHGDPVWFRNIRIRRL